MIADKKMQSRWAHASEVTSLTYVPDGSYILAAAEGSDLQLFAQGSEGRKTNQADPIETSEGARCTVVTQNSIFAGSHDGVVQQFDVKQKESMGIIIREELAIRCLALSENEILLAVGSEQTNIKIIHLEDPEKCWSFKGHKKAVNSLSFDPLGEYLLSSSCDGTVIVWNLKSKDTAPVEIINVMAPTTTDSDMRIPVAWHPSGEFFVIGKDKDIAAHHRHTWQKSFTYRTASANAARILEWSPNGRYLAAASTKAEVWVWQYKEKERPLVKHVHKTGVTDIAWCPTENRLAFSDIAGEITYWDDIIPDGTPLNELTPDPLAGLFDEPTAPPAHRGQQVDGGVQNSRDQDQEMGDLAQEYLSDNESLNDFIVDDDNGGYLEKKPAQTVRKNGATSLPMQVAKELHPRFQSGSSSQRDNRRYLGKTFECQKLRAASSSDSDETKTNAKLTQCHVAFNLLGLITSVDHGNHATVSVEFHDKLAHRGYHFTDSFHYSMACLGRTGTLFAAPSKADNASTVFFKTYDSWATKSEWQVYLPEGEDVTSIALNADSAIVSTSRGYIRIFSQSGIQTGLFSIGSVVAAAGNEDMVLFIHHQGEPFEGSQNLGYSIYNVETAQRIQHGSVPVSDGTFIIWLGFSEGGIPAFYDDKGVMHILNYYRRVDQGQWTPILDTAQLNAESESDTSPCYWPVGLTDEAATFVKCRRGETEPSFPKPFVTELPLKMPTLHQETPAGQHEEAWLRHKVLSGLNKDEKMAMSIEHRDNVAARKELEMDKLALQMIDLACRADRSQKALDLTAMLCSLKSIDNAMKIAQHHSLHTLMERMSRVKEIKIMEEQGRDPDAERELIMASPVMAIPTRKDQDTYRVSSREEEQELERNTLQRKDGIKSNDPFGRRVIKNNGASSKSANGGSLPGAANPFKKKSGGADAVGAARGFGSIVKESDKNLPITRRATDVFEAADYLAADEQRAKAQKEQSRQEELVKKRKANGGSVASHGQRTLNMFSKAAPGAVRSEGGEEEAEAKRFKKQQQQQQQQHQQAEDRDVDTAMLMDADDFLEDEEDEEPLIRARGVHVPATQDDELLEESIEETRGHLEQTRVESSLSPAKSSTSSVLAGFRFNT
ncbi:hypothetical protein EDD11_009624 [Mortierella claussenii]|nr:hypothetical protein EDD11_009624 [Mortierella claussenii]